MITMGWFRLAGTFTDHPKVLAAGNAAVGLYVRLGCWCAEHETDGFVPEEVARRSGPKRELVKLLTSTRGRPLLDVVEGGYLLRDFLAFNPSHEQQTRQRELRQKRQHRWRDATGDASRDASRDGASTPLHSIHRSLSQVQAGDAQARETAPNVDVLAWNALELVADQLAQVAAPENRGAYRRTVLTNAQDHLPALTQLARETNGNSAESIANAYINARETRTETRTE